MTVFTDRLHGGGRRPPAFLALLLALAAFAGAESMGETRIGILEAEMLLYDVSAGGVLEYRDDWSKKASRQASISAALALARAGYSPIILPDVDRTRDLYRLKTKMRYHGAAFQSEFFASAPVGSAVPEFSIGAQDSLCDRFGVDGFLYTFGYEEKFSPRRREVLQSTTGHIPQERRFTASMLAERGGMVLWYDQGALPVNLEFESGGEGVHVQSLMAQSRGMERRFGHQGLFWEDGELEEYLQSVLMKLATPEERRRYNLRVRILHNSAVDAFAAPDGAVYVCTGVLARIVSEAQIAAVLGHELAHIVGDHTQKNVQTLKEYALAEALGTLPPPAPEVTPKGDIKKNQRPAKKNKGKGAGPESEQQGAGMRRPASGYSTDMVFSSMTAALRAAVNGYRKEQEAEADSLAAARMAAAGYPRVKNLRKFINDMANIENLAMASNNEAVKGVFEHKFRHVALSDAVANFAAGRHGWTEVQLDRLLAIDECDPSALFMRGDVERMLSPRSTAWAEWYEQALACNPHDAVALRAAGFAYFAIGDKARAREYLSKYCELVPDARDIKMAREALRQCE